MLVGGPQNVQDVNAIHTEQISCSKDIIQFILQYRLQQIRSIERSLRMFDVVVNTQPSIDTFRVSARKDGLNRAVDMVKALVDKVACESFEIVQPGIASYCSKGRLDSLIKIATNEEKCHIRVEKKFLGLASGSTSSGSAVAGADSPSTNGSTAGLSPGVAGSSASSLDGSSLVFSTPQGHKISWKVGDIATEQVCQCCN